MLNNEIANKCVHAQLNKNISLFDADYFNYKFPNPQYLGAKKNLLNWINEFLPQNNIFRCLDGFGGSQSVSYYLKQKGYEVITNDFLNANNQIGISLIENKNIKLNALDIKILFSKNNNKKKLVETLWTDIFFIKQEAILLDNFRANVENLNDKYKKALAITIMNRALQKKIIMGHFAHMQAITYASNPIRVKRNASIAIPIEKLFLNLLPEYNNTIFDNNKKNQSFNENILNLLPNLENIDLVYFDPPYTNSHSDYQSFYHLLETYTEYWEDKEFINGTKKYFPTRWSGFDKKSEVVESLNKMFSLSENIKHWLISWNDRSYPNVDEMKNILLKYKKNVRVEKKVYKSSRGGKGSVAGSAEILFICN